MIDIEQSIVINIGIDQVWEYVRDIRRWANIFPGCRDCRVIDEHDSDWTIKVGVGGLVKTVNVLVHVDQWDGPGLVKFSYKLQKEPVVGSGLYTAVPQGPRETKVTLKLSVEGSGQMAPMWEAMCKPLMPQLAKMFAEQLKTAIEGEGSAAATQKLSVFTIIVNWLRNLWRMVSGSKTR